MKRNIPIRNSYKYKKRHDKTKIVFSMIITIILIFVLGVISYSIIKPISDYMKSDKNSNNSSDIQSLLESFQENINPTENIEYNKPSYNAKNIHAIRITEKDLKDEKSLKAALNNKNISEYNYILVPLKIKGGKLCYKTSTDASQINGISDSSLNLQQILSVIVDKGKKAVAEINILEDNLYPSIYSDSAFLTSDGIKWLDKSDIKNEKPWLSPYSDKSKAYIKSLTKEIASAGFKYIISSGIKFPEFKEEDINIINDPVGEENRYLQLVSIANLIYKAAAEKGSSIILEITADELLTDNSEVFQPILLECKEAILTIDVNKFNKEFAYVGGKTDFTNMTISEKVKKICEISKNSYKDIKFIPCILSKGLTEEQKNSALNALRAEGYDSFIVK